MTWSTSVTNRDLLLDTSLGLAFHSHAYRHDAKIYAGHALQSG